MRTDGPPNRFGWLVLIAVAVLLPAPAAAEEPSTQNMEGMASWYGGEFQGRLTANGEVFDTYQFTAAHRTLPFGTIVRVTRLDNGREVDVRINDRGPFVEGRVIDLSLAAAQVLEMTGVGVARVRLAVVARPDEPLRSIQIVSLSSEDAAENLALSLREEELGARVERAESGVYRVVITNVPESEVDEVVDQLADLGYQSVFVRSR